jgi:hypothetical protein
MPYRQVQVAPAAILLIVGLTPVATTLEQITSKRTRESARPLSTGRHVIIQNESVLHEFALNKIQPKPLWF